MKKHLKTRKLIENGIREMRRGSFAEFVQKNPSFHRYKIVQAGIESYKKQRWPVRLLPSSLRIKLAVSDAIKKLKKK